MRNLALFDFDGTITTGDTFIPFLRAAVRPYRAVATAVALSPVSIGYYAGLVSGPRVRPLYVRLGLKGENARDVRSIGNRYASQSLPALVRRDAMDRIDWHRRRGDEVVVVSASLDVYLEPWCRAHGLLVICTVLEEQEGMLTGRYVNGDCSGSEKARRVRVRYLLDRYSMIYAYGDSSEDREMLAMAHKPCYRWEQIPD